MARTLSAFRQQDVTRAIRGADAAGLPVRRVEIDPVSGKIVLVLSDGAAPDAVELNALDEWRAGRGAG